MARQACGLRAGLRRLPELDARVAGPKPAPLPLEEVVFSFDLCRDLRTEREPGRTWLRKVVSEICADAGGS